MGDAGSFLEGGDFFCAETVKSPATKMKMKNNPVFFIYVYFLLV
jgi:hypothetical protein